MRKLMPKTVIAVLALSGLLVAAAPASAAVVDVAGDTATPVLLTNLTAGVTYHLTATGMSDLYAGYNSGAGLKFDADGTPAPGFINGYAAFEPNGLTYDPTSGLHGPAGTNANLGALIGTFSAVPGGPADYFLIGTDFTFIAAADGAIFGLVNDTDYRDNATAAFQVTIASPEAGGVPEPGVWALMIVGFGLAGVTLRRGRSTATAATI